MRTARAFGLLAASAAGAFLTQPSLGQAQMAAAETASPVVVQSLLRDIAMLEQKLVGLAEAIPEESYDWRPGEGVRSVGEVMMHVAADNYFLPIYADVAAPEETGIKPNEYPTVQAYENRTVTKAEALEALRASFDHLRQAMEGTDDAFLARGVNVFGNEMSGLDLWVLTTTHLHEHLGQMIAYARSNGIVPPWSG